MKKTGLISKLRDRTIVSVNVFDEDGGIILMPKASAKHKSSFWVFFLYNPVFSSQIVYFICPHFSDNALANNNTTAINILWQ